VCVCRVIFVWWRMYGTTSNWALVQIILREFWVGNFNLRACPVRDVAKGDCEP